MAYCVIYSGSQYTLRLANLNPVSDISQCTTGVLLQPNEYGMFSDTLNITSDSLTESFLWGFGAIISVWGLAYGIRIAKAVIRQL